MKNFIFLTTLIFGQLSLAHYECTGICKWHSYGSLQSGVVSGSGSTYSIAQGKMNTSCSNNCYGENIKGCTIVNYSCSTPEHAGPYALFSEILGIYNNSVETSNSQQ